MKVSPLQVKVKLRGTLVVISFVVIHISIALCKTGRVWDNTGKSMDEY